ncbi:MAG: glycosyltransferase family 2 protein, partial [Vicinamibacteria bacterium]
NGRVGLETCLPSLEHQDYRPDRLEILLVDNASTDDSVSFAREQFPSVRIISCRGNLGRGPAIRSALPQARGDYIAFLDPNVRVESTWLRELVNAVVRENAAVAASKILDRDGQRIEFAGGIVSLVGHTWPIGGGASPASCGTEPAPLLFGSTAAMLVERSAFDAAGGFDPDYFACGEDLDLGWRLALLGYRAVLAPRSLAYRDAKADGTAVTPRVRLEERNALYTIYKCYGEVLLYRVLPVAIALTLARALDHSNLDATDFSPGATPPETARVSRRTVATLMALEDFARNLGCLRKKRETIQSRRRVADEVILPLFVEPLKTHDLGPAYQRIASELFEEFELSSLASGNEPPPADRTVTVRGNAGLVSHAMESDPSVSIIIPTLLGPTHLPECLSSLRALSYPKGKLQVIVVDNGSKEDPTPTVRQHYPEAKVVRLSENRGFSGGIAAGVREAAGEWLAFLNDDTRVDEEWIGEMVATAARRRTPCVAARILNWTGDRIDFAGGGVSFEAKGFQLGHGSTQIDSWTEERPVLFACGAAMLVRRDLFLETGGFDEAMFAYYEDVAFGWGLTIRGYDVWISPRALVYHKHQGTAGLWAGALRTRLYERNALRTVFTHLERQTLQRALPASLLLINQRILLTTGLFRQEPGDWSLVSSLRRAYLRARNTDGARGGIKSILAELWPLTDRPTADGSRAAAYRMEEGPQERSFDGHPESLPAEGAARLLALHDWLKSLPEQRHRRREIQEHRRRGDAEILSAFPARWTQPVGAEPRAVYRRVHETVVDALALRDIALPRDHRMGPGGA